MVFAVVISEAHVAGAWKELKPPAGGQLLLERRRYDAAQTAGELESVFKAAAPIVESILRALLQIHFPNRRFATLGPMINAWQQNNIGSYGLWAQLNHILKFGRGLAEHGHTISESVLRTVWRAKTRFSSPRSWVLCSRLINLP